MSGIRSKVGDIYLAYVEWAKREGEIVDSLSTFLDVLESRGYTITEDDEGVWVNTALKEGKE